jgi:hypothetical protein
MCRPFGVPGADVEALTPWPDWAYGDARQALG